jgi:hypothetical protein
MKTHSAILLRAAFTLAAAPLFTGCVGALPKPVSTTKVEYGVRLKEADVAFIQPGRTTRKEVVAHLGTNFTALPEQRALAWSWEMQGGGWIWWWWFVGPYDAAGDTGSAPAAGGRSWSPSTNRASFGRRCSNRPLPAARCMNTCMPGNVRCRRSRQRGPRHEGSALFLRARFEYASGNDVEIAV